MLNRIVLVVHPTRAVDGALATLTRWAEDHGIPVVQAGDARRAVAPRADPAPGDLVVALGGDGTVLAALRAALAVDAPVLGVACGSLGALSAVTAHELGEALDRVWSDAWTPRSMPALSIEGAEGPDHWAINDFVVVRRGAGQLVVEVHVEDELYARLAGDGLIVATPLGSSAYSMAAGGPVLASDASAFVCTPLAMHGGSAPPLVLSGETVATVVVAPRFAGFDVEIDGQDRAVEGYRFELRLQPDRVRLVSLDPPGRGLTGLRRRGLIIDSPRLLARDERAKGT